MIVTFRTDANEELVLDMNRIVAVLVSEEKGCVILMECSEPIDVPIEVARSVISRWQGV